MIEITRYKENYSDSLKKMMLQENLDYNEVSLCLDTLYVVLEKQEILGFGYFNLYDNDLFIDHLYIKKSERLNKLGDSLFRTILNALNLSSIKKVYMRNNDLYHDFLVAEDIELTEDKKQFLITLPDFFERKCRGSKISNQQLN